MDYLIVYNGEPIGTIVSPRADASMGMVHGPFMPLPAYEKVRAVFRLFSEATGMGNGTGYPDDPEKLRRFYAERDALDLSVTTRDGLPIPTAWAHVYDFSEERGETGYEGEFNVASAEFFGDARLWANPG